MPTKQVQLLQARGPGFEPLGKGGDLGKDLKRQLANLGKGENLGKDLLLHKLHPLEKGMHLQKVLLFVARGPLSQRCLDNSNGRVKKEQLERLHMQPPYHPHATPGHMCQCC